MVRADKIFYPPNSPISSEQVGRDDLLSTTALHRHEAVGVGIYRPGVAAAVHLKEKSAVFAVVVAGFVHCFGLLEATVDHVVQIF